MKFLMDRNDETDMLKVSLEIGGREYAFAPLTDFDRALLRECESSDKTSDKLLALETIVRRIEEGRGRG